MRYVVQFFDGEHNRLLGSDGSRIVGDLKTVRGVRQRMRKAHRSIPSRARRYVIYRVTGHNFYDERNWHEVTQGHIADFDSQETF